MNWLIPAHAHTNTIVRMRFHAAPALYVTGRRERMEVLEVLQNVIGQIILDNPVALLYSILKHLIETVRAI